MKKISTLVFISVFLFLNQGKSQSACPSSATSYDMVFSNNTVLAPSPTSLYMMGYICSGVTVTDSMTCCTRIIHVEQGGTLIVGPLSYGAVYLKAGATFDGQNTAQNWFIYAETGSTVLNYSGTVVACTSVTFPSASCFTSVANTEPEKEVAVMQQQDQLLFSFSKPESATRIELYDISGKLLLNENAANASAVSLNIASLGSGMYLYRIYKGEELIQSDKISLIR